MSAVIRIDYYHGAGRLFYCNIKLALYFGLTRVDPPSVAMEATNGTVTPKSSPAMVAFRPDVEGITYYFYLLFLAVLTLSEKEFLILDWKK